MNGKGREGKPVNRSEMSESADRNVKFSEWGPNLNSTELTLRVTVSLSQLPTFSL